MKRIIMAIAAVAAFCPFAGAQTSPQEYVKTLKDADDIAVSIPSTSAADVIVETGVPIPLDDNGKIIPYPKKEWLVYVRASGSSTDAVYGDMSVKIGEMGPLFPVSDDVHVVVVLTSGGQNVFPEKYMIGQDEAGNTIWKKFENDLYGKIDISKIRQIFPSDKVVWIDLNGYDTARADACPDVVIRNSGIYENSLYNKAKKYLNACSGKAIYFVQPPYGVKSKAKHPITDEMPYVPFGFKSDSGNRGALGKFFGTISAGMTAEQVAVAFAQTTTLYPDAVFNINAMDQFNSSIKNWVGGIALAAKGNTVVIEPSRSPLLYLLYQFHQFELLKHGAKCSGQVTDPMCLNIKCEKIKDDKTVEVPCGTIKGHEQYKNIIAAYKKFILYPVLDTTSFSEDKMTDSFRVLSVWNTATGKTMPWYDATDWNKVQKLIRKANLTR